MVPTGEGVAISQAITETSMEDRARNQKSQSFAENRHWKHWKHWKQYWNHWHHWTLPKREKGREMRAASAESLSPEKTAGKSPWPILLGSRQGSFSSFSGDTISYGLRRSNGWAALQCQEVMQTISTVSPVGVVRSKKCRPSTPPQPV